MAEKPGQSSNFSHLLISNVEFTNTILGRGADATVYAVKWNGTMCAAKRLHEILLEDDTLRGAGRLISNFEQECLTWSKLRHPAVVQFLGVCLEPRSRLPVLVMEKMDTSLRRYLENHSKEEFPLHLKAFVLRQVSEALAYLHTQDPVLVHHDLTTNNVLLNEGSFVTKVTDFGMSRAVNPSILSRKSSIKGTLAFMSPEALQDSPRYNDKLDIFSFGNVVISTVTHEWPNPSQPTYIKGSKIMGRSELQRREQYCIMFTAEEKLFLPIVQQCLENAPDKRPSSTVLVRELQCIQSSIPKGSLAAPVASAAEGKGNNANQKSWGTGEVEMFRGVAMRWKRSQADEPKASSEEVYPLEFSPHLHFPVQSKMTGLERRLKRSGFHFKVFLLGDRKSGKNGLLSYILEDPSHQSVSLYSEYDYVTKTVKVDGENVVLQLQQYPECLIDETKHPSYFRANGILLIYDITDNNSYMDAKDALFEWMINFETPDTVFMLVGNECHLSHLRAVSTEEAEDFAKEHSAMFIEMSFVEDMSSFDTAFLDFVREMTKRDQGI